MRRFAFFTITGVTLVLCNPSLTRGDAGLRSPQDMWRAWTLDPLVLLVISVWAGLYWRGLSILCRRTLSARRIRPAQAAAFYSALSLSGLALLSPLDALAGQLVAAHMIQHMLLIFIIAPLLVFGSPMQVLAFSVPHLWRQLLGLKWLTHRAAWHPAIVWWLFALALWGWHHPALYQAALQDPLVHDAQHLSFLVTAFLFWRIVLDPISRRRMHPVACIPYLFTASLHASVLGIFLALSPHLWYPVYGTRGNDFGFTPLADQQVAGLIMWVPCCVVFPLTAAALLVRWLARESAHTAERECLA